MNNPEDQDLEIEYLRNRVIELEQCLSDVLQMSRYLSAPICRRIKLCYDNSGQGTVAGELPDELALKAWTLTYKNRQKRNDDA